MDEPGQLSMDGLTPILATVTENRRVRQCYYCKWSTTSLEEFNQHLIFCGGTEKSCKRCGRSVAKEVFSQHEKTCRKRSKKDVKTTSKSRKKKDSSFSWNNRWSKISLIFGVDDRQLTARIRDCLSNSDQPGRAYCDLCEKYITFRTRGKDALIKHMQTQAHMKKFLKHEELDSPCRVVSEDRKFLKDQASTFPKIRTCRFCQCPIVTTSLRLHEGRCGDPRSPGFKFRMKRSSFAKEAQPVTEAKEVVVLDDTPETQDDQPAKQMTEKMQPEDPSQVTCSSDKTGEVEVDEATEVDGKGMEVDRVIEADKEMEVDKTVDASKAAEVDDKAISLPGDAGKTETSLSDCKSRVSLPSSAADEVDSKMEELKRMLGTKEKPFYCIICDKAFRKRRNFRDHFQTHQQTIQERRCRYCQLKFKSAHKLQSHTLRHALRQATPCQHCGLQVWQLRVFGNSTCYLENRHDCIFEVEEEKEAVASRKTCKLCTDKTFTDHSRALLHAHLHAIMAPYPCTKCDMSFATRNDRVVHKHQVHSCQYTSTHICKICGTRLRGISRLIHHRDFSACGSLGGIHVCPHCNKGFISAKELSRHVNCSHFEHGKSKSLTCPFCKLFTADITSLKPHIAEHFGGKEFDQKLAKTFEKCFFCGVKCLSLFNMIQHLSAKHSGQIPEGYLRTEAACRLCGEKQENMYTHMKNCHSGSAVSAAPGETSDLHIDLCNEENIFGEESNVMIGDQGSRLNSSSEFTCPFCSFSSHSMEMEVHVAKHVDDMKLGKVGTGKLKKCFFCRRNCGNFFNLLIHIKARHTHEIFSKRKNSAESVKTRCSICGEPCDNLYVHMKEVHTSQNNITKSSYRNDETNQEVHDVIDLVVSEDKQEGANSHEKEGDDEKDIASNGNTDAHDMSKENDSSFGSVIVCESLIPNGSQEDEREVLASKGISGDQAVSMTNGTAPTPESEGSCGQGEPNGDNARRSPADEGKECVVAESDSETTAGDANGTPNPASSAVCETVVSKLGEEASVNNEDAEDKLDRRECKRQEFTTDDNSHCVATAEILSGNNVNESDSDDFSLVVDESF